MNLSSVYLLSFASYIDLYAALRLVIYGVYWFYVYKFLYNNQINARALIGQSAMVYCAGKPMEKSRVLRIII